MTTCTNPLPVRDPVSPVPELLRKARLDPVVGETNRRRLDALRERQQALGASPDRTAWAAFYADARDAIRGLHAELAGAAAERPGTGDASEARRALAVDVVRDASRLLSRADQHAIRYVAGKRVPRQRAGQIGRLLDQLADTATYEESIEAHRVQVSTPEAERKRLVQASAEILADWAGHCIRGTEARVTNTRRPVLERLQEPLATLALPPPPMPVARKDFEVNPIAPTWTLSEPRQSAVQMLWRFFRASMGVLFVVTMLFGLLIRLLYPEGPSQPQIMVAMACFFLLFSGLLTALNRGVEGQALRDKLRDDLKASLKGALNQAANETRDEIMAVIEAYESDLDINTSLWSLGHQLPTSRTRSPMGAGAANDAARRSLAELATQCLQAIDDRLARIG